MVYLLQFVSYIAGSKSVSARLLTPDTMNNTALEGGLYRPAVASSTAILNRSFRYSAPILWNSLAAKLRCSKDSGSPGPNLVSKSTFLSKLKTHFFHKSYSFKPASVIASSRSKLTR